MCWEYIKYQIRKFSIRFSKENAKKARVEIVTFENKLKELEQKTDCIFDRKYLDCKNKLEQIYEEKANGIKIRSKCEWYKFGEKSSKFFLTLEKIYKIYKNVLTERLKFQKEDISLSQINIPILTEEQS